MEELDEGRVPAEPRLQSAVDELLPRGISGSELADLEGGWASWLVDPPEAAAFTERGPYLFRLGARLLNVEIDDAIVTAVGRLFVVVDVARRGVNEIAFGNAGIGSLIVPRQARPLTALGALAVRDLKRGGPQFEPEATPGRAWTLLRHRLTGRLR